MYEHEDHCFPFINWCSFHIFIFHFIYSRKYTVINLKNNCKKIKLTILTGIKFFILMFIHFFCNKYLKMYFTILIINESIFIKKPLIMKNFHISENFSLISFHLFIFQRIYRKTSYYITGVKSVIKKNCDLTPVTFWSELYYLHLWGVSIQHSIREIGKN